jgi:hypothetical protein
MGPDGIVYLLAQISSRPHLVAIQTPSPGPANSAWPMSRHDAYGSNWLAP